MDPLGAVSLAGTVVQLLDFGIKLIGKTHEIYVSTEGAEVRNIELNAIAQNLISLNQRVRNRLRNVSVQVISDDEEALATLMGNCIKIGEELVAALQRTKVEGAHRAWKSVRQALKSSLGRDKIEDLYSRLKQYREQIVVVLLSIISAKQTELDETVQNMRQDILSSESRLVNESRRSRFQILDAISQSHYRSDQPRDVAIVSELLSDMISRTSQKKSEEFFLNSLYYPRMKDRREWISEAHTKTFRWALEKDIRRPVPWSDLGRWLEQENGIYWLSGKAGSGKSTLMKFIHHNERTKRYLEDWASPMPLIVASFYFWNAGTTMQKSQLGLLQSLLYEILVERPMLISKVFPMRWQLSLGHSNMALDWTLSELSSALKFLAETELRTRFCFIIDGLDEFDGDHQSLISLLFSLTRTSNVKILASSRPWLVFKDAFANCPKLVLEDLTYNDIKVFAQSSLHNHTRFQRLLASEPDQILGLVTEIVDKATGVFLWVYLVVRSLMDGLTNADRISDLQRRLRELPADLEQYFLHILTSLDPFYIYQASQFFRLALEARQPLSVLTFSYLDEDDPDYAIKRKIESLSVEEEEARCETIERRLNSRCKGLLESHRRQGCDEYSNIEGLVGERIFYEVHFLHRTVRDFLSTPTNSAKLVAEDTPRFNANMTLARAFVAQVKGLRCASHSETNFQRLWEIVFEALYHLRCTGDDIFSEEQAKLLDEMDKAAAHFRMIAIVKRRCDPAAHWVNTGYRFGLEPKWNNDLLTLCVQKNLLNYVREKLSSGETLSRRGRPLLAFAMTGFKETSSLQNAYSSREEDLFLKGTIHYNIPQVAMVKLLLDSGADPNDIDENATIWARYLSSLYILATIGGSNFYKQTKEWFEITKLLIISGADPRAICIAVVPLGDLAKRLNLKKEERKVGATYSAIDLVRLIFGGASSYDVGELEDLLEQPPPPGNLRNVSDSRLQVPGQRIEAEVMTHSRNVSGSSLATQASAQSWRRHTPEDAIIPLQTSTICQEEHTVAPAIQSHHLETERQKRRSILGKFLHRKKEKPTGFNLYPGT